jgi:ABC-type spermidine/putrescine transport system permease subunit I
MSLVDDMNAKLEQSSSFFNSTGLLLTGWIIYLPPVLFLTIFFIIPVLMISFTSIYPRISVSSELGLTLKFYSDAINPSYLSPFWRSIWYGLATTAFSLILAYPVVYAAVKIFQEYEVLILLFSVLPFWVMYLIRMFGWNSILKDGGLIDEIVVALGLGIDASFLYSAPAVVLGLVFSWYPLMVFPLYASIKSLDDSLIEASKDLGANAFHTFTRVTVPETKSGIIAGSILVCSIIWFIRNAHTSWRS